MSKGVREWQWVEGEGGKTRCWVHGIGVMIIVCGWWDAPLGLAGPRLCRRLASSWTCWTHPRSRSAAACPPPPPPSHCDAGLNGEGFKLHWIPSIEMRAHVCTCMFRGHSLARKTHCVAVGWSGVR